MTLSTRRSTSPSSAPARPRLPAGRLFLVMLLFSVALPGFVALPARAAAVPAVWPLQPPPEVVRGFERPTSPWLPGHRGVDLVGAPGQPVLSAAAGTVTYAGQLAGRGVIVVSHGRTRTTYEPVVPSIRRGVTVTTGEPIGRLSAAGSHCFPRVCLHWGLRSGVEYLDPLSLLASRPVRLLPLDPQARTVRRDGDGRTSALRDPDVGSAAAAPAAAVTDGELGAGKTSGDATAASAGRAGAPARGGGDAAAGIVVGLAAAVTIGGGLLIRRH
ncbi:MAG TPA: M23 family metallopeptidase [Kribbella sp.]|nr:M23 family metallopeptidase [Kribbella sp.]